MSRTTNGADRPRFTTDRPDGRFVETIAWLHSVYRDWRPKLAFDPEMDPAGFDAWRDRVRDKLRELMTLPDPPPQPEPVQVWAEPREGYELQRWEAYPEPGLVVPYLALVPEGVDADNPAPAVMCFPGSASSKESLAGEPEPDGSTSDHPHWERNRMAWRYAREGMVAVAVDNPGIGELWHPFYSGRTELDMAALWIGRSYEGISVSTKLPILEWLKARPFVDPDRIATAGHSLGAKPALIIGVLDRSIRAVVWNDFCSSWRERAVVMNLHVLGLHQYVPGFLEWFDYTDLLASLAPRSLIITEGGRTRDIEVIRRAWRMLGAEENFELAYYPKFADPASRRFDDVDMPEGLDFEEFFKYVNVDVEQHSFKYEVAVPWLKRQLAPREA
ncbi:MAG: hypothetical protein J7M38_00495 [Armatimonadetes bacterium]|nr:hypothetical protein [Armatimonadota bacterium]